MSPWGDIEPCPVIQMAKESIHDDRPLKETFNESEFLRDFRETAARATRGCIVLERPDLLQELAERHGARDTTARAAVFAELKEMETRPSQYNPVIEIPEKNWAYRLAKRFWFNDYGMYGKHFKAENWQPTSASSGTQDPADAFSRPSIWSSSKWEVRRILSPSLPKGRRASGEVNTTRGDFHDKH